MTTETIHAVASRRVECTVHYDESADPRDADNFGTIVTEDRYGVNVYPARWDAATKGRARTVREVSTHDYMRGESVAVRVDLPSSWTDRGAPDGFAYVTRADLIREYGAANADARERARRVLESEATEFRAWTDGYSFGVVWTEYETCACCGMERETSDDSIWGFTTYEPARDLPEWAGEYAPTDAARAALAIACGDGWTGEYPAAGRGSIAVA